MHESSFIVPNGDLKWMDFYYKSWEFVVGYIPPAPGKGGGVEEQHGWTYFKRVEFVVWYIPPAPLGGGEEG